MASVVTACPTCELHAEAVFRVEGMDCRDEVVILERRLKPLTGVEALSADLVGQTLRVTYDAAKLTTSTLVDAVGDAGLRMWLEHEEPAAPRGGLAWRWRLVFAAGAVVLAGAGLASAGFTRFSGLMFLLAVCLGGVYPARRALTAVRSGVLDINVLMVVAVSGAVALGDYSEAASVVFLFALAQWLEARTLDRARQAIRALLDLSPPEALVVRQGSERMVRVEEIAIGETVIVRPGERVSLDGVIVSGLGDLNEAPLTGEPLPVDKGPGADVYAGTINGRAALEVRVTRLRRDTRLARIIALVETAQAQRAPVQSLVERFARIYTPVVIGLALAMAVVPVLAGGSPSDWGYRAIVLLVIACPCALVISTPVSVVSALAGAARHGVLIKGGIHLERLARVRAVAFDKTGTLTMGAPAVTEVVPCGRWTESTLLAVAAALEMRAEHPIARAILAGAKAAGVQPGAAQDVTILPGLGAEGLVDGRPAVVGSERLLSDRGLVAAPGALPLSSLRGQGRTLVFVGVDGQLAGVIAVADRVRATARRTIDLLRQHGIEHVAMITGDHPEAAAIMARELGIDSHEGGLLPEQKHAAVGALRSRYESVLMVGDGINDAPALAAADVGVALGAAASDVALETADVALLSGELLKLPYAVRLARATLRNVRTNIAISLAMKAAFVALAVTGMATLWMAILADTGASVIVVVNALRLLRSE